MDTQQIYNTSNITNFIVDIPDVGLTKGFTLNAQAANIPGIRIPITEVPSGSMGLGRANLPGSTFEFDPLVIRFLIDENLDSWLQMYQWMIGINNYQTGDNFIWRDGSSPEHVSVHILNNDKTKIVLSVHYYGCWISDLGEVEFNYTEDTDPAITCQAILPYKYLQIEKDGKIITTRQSMPEAANARIGMHPSMRK